MTAPGFSTSASVVLAAVLVAAAVLVWPRRPRGPGDLRGMRASSGPRGSAREVVLDPPGVVAHVVARVGAQILGGRRSTARAAAREVGPVLALLDALGPALRAGLPPAEALRALAEPDGSGASSEAVGAVPGLVADLVDAADRGEPLAPVWRAGAARYASPDLALVASAWSLCERLGAPLAATVTTVASVVRRRAEVDRRTAAALAGPRASMTVLSALPVAGPLLALVMGLSPVELYASPPGVAALAVGLLLLLLGRWWGGRLVRSIGLGQPGPSGRRASRTRSGA